MTTDAPPRTAREMLARGRAFLERHDVAEARLDAELLVAHALGTDRLHLFLDLERPVADAEVRAARELLVRRSKGEPCAYLIGRREFYGRDFEVGPGVLIPRPETELLVDRARELFGEREAPVLVDVGTGSGCLACTLALEIEGARVTGTDISAQALAQAGKNAAALGVAVELVLGDGLAPVRERVTSDGRVDGIVSNPPYVDPDDPALAPEVREHEPAEALFAPAGDPDHWVRRLVREARELLKPGGVLLVELGHDQAPRVRAWLESEGVQFTLHADLAGLERVLEVSY